MRIQHTLSAVLAGLLLAAALSAPALAAEDARIRTREEAARHAVRLAAEYGGADSIRYALWEGGEITLQGGWGVYSRSENRALTEDILYGVGSVSKTYTAAAVLKLCEGGALTLETPVAEILPEFCMADERYQSITVRMLLDHSSGLMGDSTRNAFLFDDTDPQAADALLRRLATQRLKAEPGAYCVYSNDGSTLAELVVEAASGMEYMDYVRAALLAPGELADTFAPGGDFDPDRLARTYASPQDPRALPQDTLGIVGTGGIYATAADLASFGGLLCGTELLSRASLDAMTADWAARGLWPEDSADDQLGYGLGWDNVHMFPFGQNGIQALVKGGDTLRYHAGLIVLPEHDMAVAVLSSGGVSTYNQLAGARILVDALAQRGITVDESWSLPEAEPARLPQAVLSYAGTYAGLTGMLTASFDEAGALTLAAPAALGGAPMTLTYYDDGSFRGEEETLLVKFIPEENGRVYLYEKAYSDIPGLVPLGAASYAMERLEPNGEASEEALAAWEARGEKLYLIANEKYTSQVYLSGPFTAVSTLAEAPGYAALDWIEDADTARQYLQLPGTGSRNGADYTVQVEDGTEYLTVGDYLCMDSAAARPLWGGEGAYTTIQSDGRARWYQVGALAGGTLNVTLPEAGTFYVYDQLGQVVAGSWAFGDTHALLPEGGWIVFAGEPGTRFPLSVTEEAQ